MNGIHADSRRNPYGKRTGFHAESERNTAAPEPARARARSSARACAAPPVLANHSTALHITALHGTALRVETSTSIVTSVARESRDDWS